MTIKQPDPARVLRIPQEEETPLTTLNTPFGTILYLYSRSNDSIDADVVGTAGIADEPGPTRR